MKPFDIKGRATRSTFWWFAGAVVLLHLLVFIVSIITVTGQSASFFQIAIANSFLFYAMICFWSAGLRRVNDLQFGWTAILALFVYTVSALVVLLCLIFMLIVVISGVFSGYQPHTEQHMLYGILAYIFYPTILAFAVAANAIFWLLPSALNPNEVPS